MGSDDSDDDSVTEINVEVDPSLISEITITATGVSSVTAYADTASPADSEPTTLEPRLVVRGLGKRASPPPPPPPTFAEVGVRRGSEAEDEAPEEDKTTQNIESHLHQVYERAVSASTSSESSAPRTQLSPIITTPSEPMRPAPLSRTAIAGTVVPRPPAPIPAAGRPSEPAEWESELSDVTAWRDPDGPDGKELADAIRSSAARDGDDDYEEETKTDAIQSQLVASTRAPAKTVPMIGEEPETRTVKAPLTTASAQALFIDPPRSEPAVGDGRPKLDALAAAGGTVRMFFNPATGKATEHPDSERSPIVMPPPIQSLGLQPTVQALPIQQPALMGAPAIVRDLAPAAIPAPSARPRKPRRTGRLVLLFVVACAASAAGVHYRRQLVSWFKAHAEIGSRAPTPAPQPPPASAPAATPSVAPATPSVEPASAPATPSVEPASASASASAAADPRKSKKGPPPKK